MSNQSQFALLTQKRFVNFFISAIAATINDNIFKNFLILLVTYHAAEWTIISPGLLANLAAGIFILPYVLFSATAGQLADRYDKAHVMQVIKASEVGIMCLVGVGFYLHSLPVLLGILFLLGTHSAFFGPVKYSVLPRVLHQSELTGGNGLVEMGTFIGILGGTIAAGVLAGSGAPLTAISAILITIAVVGLIASFGIPKTGSAAPDLKVDYSLLRPTVEVLRDGREVKSVWLSLMGISWFWFFGALILSQLPGLAKVTLGGDEALVTWLLAFFSIGVAAGSLLCEKLSSKTVEIGLVPFGSIGLSVFAADLYFAATSYSGAGLPIHVLVDLSLVGLFGGFYIVPLYALIQSRSPRAKQSRVVAANNILNALFMVVSAGLGAGLLAAGVSIPGVILTAAILNVLVAVYIYSIVPEFLWRFVDWLVVHSLYRVRVNGQERIPEEGAALLVCNHVSFADALVLAAAVPRPVRFVMDHSIFKTPVVNGLFRAAKAIPIASAKSHPEVYDQAFEAIDAALANGELVLIFPEGKITYDGVLSEFKAGYLKVLERRAVPLIPMGVEGLWGSVFSRKPGSRSLKALARELMLPVTVSVGTPISGELPRPDELRNTVAGLAGVRDAVTAA
jgi:1-acyl-sn-glycerol-3-phosphate acyltransferase